MEKLKKGDSIICVKDCYDNTGILIHTKGEHNEVYINQERLHITIYEENMPHTVSHKFLSKYFINLSKHREKKITKLLN